jgi:hypothetical protein
LEVAGEGIDDIRLSWMHPFTELRKKSHAGNRWPAFIEHNPVDAITKNDRIDIRHAKLPVVVYCSFFWLVVCLSVLRFRWPE